MAIITPLKIDKESYKLDENHYHKNVLAKSQIVLGNTFSSNMCHVEGWKLRHGANYKKVSPFTVDINGNIFQHYEPKYYSDFINITNVNDYSIPIVLENVGRLNKVGDKYYTLTNNEYKGKVLNKAWRDGDYWAMYSTKQIDSTARLCKYLCDLFEIELDVKQSNTMDENIGEFEGICFRSNYLKHYTDISPAFNINKFETKVL